MGNRVVRVSSSHPDRISFRGENKLFRDYKGNECILSGPAETGKTFTVCFKLNWLLMKYSGSQAAMIRQVRADMPGSVIQTWDKLIQPLIDSGRVKKHGGENPEFYEYENGSRLWIGGMDRPGKILSSERDFIYICQAEELKLEAYETITTRCTGRAANAPFPQIMMDCNPGSDKHWILDRAKIGKLKMFESRHEDNPTLYQNGEWTERGQKTLAILNALTGARLQRLRFGRWVGQEGVVYERFDKTKHVCKRFDIPADAYRYMSVDWGFRDPMVVQWWAVIGEKAYSYREIYATGRRVEDVAKQVKQLSDGERIEFATTDHDPDKQLTFEQYSGITCYNAKKEIDDGIQAVDKCLEAESICFFEDSLVEADENLLDDHGPVCTVDEFDCYAWPKDKAGKSRKEKPVDANNHGMDAMRYFVREWEFIKTGAYEVKVTT